MYKKYLLVLTIVSTIIISLNYAKITILYHPLVTTTMKHQKFYQKLLQLTTDANLIVETVTTTVDDFQLDTLHVKNPNSDKCIIYFHGNGGNISTRFEMIKFLYQFCSIIIFDYRSYGRSGGEKISLCCKALQADSSAIWSYATIKESYHPNNLILFGESLGCSMAVWLGSELSKTFNENNYPSAIILNSPFYSLSSMINIFFKKMNVEFIGTIFDHLFGNEYQSDEWSRYINYGIKVIIAHSQRDEVIPYKEGVKLFDTIKKSHPNSRFITITGTHNDFGMTDEYIYAIADLID